MTILRSRQAHRPFHFYVFFACSAATVAACADEVEQQGIASADLCLEDPEDPVLGSSGGWSASEDYPFPTGERALSANEPYALVAYWSHGNAVAEDERAHCAVTLVGNELRVSGKASWRTSEGGFDSTYGVYARCVIPPLDPGQYTLVVDGRRAPLTIPSETAACFNPL